MTTNNTELMSGRQRVFCTLDHKEPDMVPITESVYSRPFFKEVLGSVPKNYDAEALTLCAQKVGYDMIVVPFGGLSGFTPESGGAEYQDEWGTTFRKQESTWPVDAPVGFPIKDEQDLKNYVFPDPNLESRLNGLKTALSMNRGYDKFIAGAVRGPFSGSWMLTGFENLLINMYEDPAFVREVLKNITDFAITGGLRMIEAGVHAVQFSDDYGSNHAPFMSEELFNEFIKPEMKRIIDAFHGKGIKVIMHSDGNLNKLLPHIMENRIDAYHPVERSAQMDIKDVKARYGKTITLIGNINNKSTLVKGSPADVEEEVRECIGIAAPGGGFILASDHSIHDDIPNENVFALYDAGRRYGKYPILI